MTPPKTKKRVSARSSVMPKPSGPQEGSAPSTPGSRAVPAIEGRTAPAGRMSKSKNARIAARRGSVSPHPAVPPPAPTAEPKGAASKRGAEARETEASADESARSTPETPRSAAIAAPTPRADAPKPSERPPARKGSTRPPSPQAKEAPVTRTEEPTAPPRRSAITSSLPPEGAEEEAPARAATPAQPAAARIRPAAPAAEADVERSRIEIDAEPEGDIFGDASGDYSPMAAVTDTGGSGAEQPRGGDSRLSRSSRQERNREAAPALPNGLAGTEYYLRQYGAHGIRALSSEVDEFGFDPHFDETARPMLDLLVRRYFRVSVEGAQHLPNEGRALIVANRSGTLPWDGLVMRAALRNARAELAPLRWLTEDSIYHYPFLGVFMNRLGAVRACPENAERLLRRERLVAVFPEGAQGSSKLFKQRYQLQRFGRGGYVKLALRHGAPIIPTAVIGAEETNPLLRRSRLLGRPLGAEFLPITPTFPWLGPLGLVPAPVKWRILFGEPVDLSSYGPEAAEDGLVVHRLNEQIRAIIQSLVDQALASRKSALFA